MPVASPLRRVGCVLKIPRAQEGAVSKLRLLAPCGRAVGGPQVFRWIQAQPRLGVTRKGSLEERTHQLVKELGSLRGRLLSSLLDLLSP